VYSSSETGPICVNDAPDADVRVDVVGRPLPGVEVAIGDSPASDAAAAPARIWVRSPWGMEGYGFPPVLSRPGMRDGWWPTSDLGVRHDSGELTLAGRIDDSHRTHAGRVVNLTIVAAAIRQLNGVSDAAAVPVATAAGGSFGVVVESNRDGLDAAAIRASLTGLLPPWAIPRRCIVMAAMPRLASGKVDRLACARALQGDTS
jgi:acyl-CoA synthetase (AMP-forming)/AMP-acid ligase II